MEHKCGYIKVDSALPDFGGGIYVSLKLVFYALPSRSEYQHRRSINSLGIHVRFTRFQSVATSAACDAGRSAFASRIKRRELPQMRA